MFSLKWNFFFILDSQVTVALCKTPDNETLLILQRQYDHFNGHVDVVWSEDLKYYILLSCARAL